MKSPFSRSSQSEPPTEVIGTALLGSFSERGWRGGGGDFWPGASKQISCSWGEEFLWGFFSPSLFLLSSLPPRLHALVGREKGNRREWAPIFFIGVWGRRDWDTRFAGFVLKKSAENNFPCEIECLLVFLSIESAILVLFSISWMGGARHGVSSCLEKEGKERNGVSLSPHQSLHSYLPFPQAQKRTNRNVWKGFFFLLSLSLSLSGKGTCVWKRGEEKTVGWRWERIMAP